MARAKKAKLLPRPKPTGCVHCSRPAPQGQLPYEWDVHLRASKEHEGGFIMVLSCSPGCRRVLELAERKG